MSANTECVCRYLCSNKIFIVETGRIQLRACPLYSCFVLSFLLGFILFFLFTSLSPYYYMNISLHDTHCTGTVLA
jgi:hypothetical protein